MTTDTYAKGLKHRKEIRETLIHVIPYCGFPAAFDAFEVAEGALRDDDNDDQS